MTRRPLLPALLFGSTVALAQTGGAPLAGSPAAISLAAAPAAISLAAAPAAISLAAAPAAISLAAAPAAISPAAAPAAPAATSPAASSGRIVLPDSVTPDHYRLEVTPDTKTLTFKGSVQIDVTVHRPTNTIVLNAADLKIDRARVPGDGVRAIHYDTQAQTATFELAHPLAAGAHTLSLEYHGTIYRQSSGLFVLDYATAHGTARALFTQFENSDARRFVPCWDEPGRKATFELTVTVPAADMAVSNMPVAAEQPLAGGLKRVRFGVTPKMSSYLLFLAAGDFERVHRLVDGIDVGVIVKRGDTASAGFALDAAVQILPYYDEYFGTRYPLPKLDLIGAPGASQFFGAMENWGAIFYFEAVLLIDPRISTERDRENVYVVVAHEMAHQWFGDLVTMAWWDDLWLNEGFASWMENKVTQHFHPEWKIWLQSLAGKQAVMQEDARDGTHPIITPIDDVLQASGAFDAITYTKGAAVIRMLESYLGEDAFRAGVRRYIREHAYGNTVTDDLWRAEDAESPGHPITAIAHDFTHQAGVPVITEAALQCGQVTLEQSHFAIDADSTRASVWHVPVLIEPIGGAPIATVVAAPAAEPLKLAGCGPLVLNAGQTGYFRSRYSDQGLADLTRAYPELSPDDQLGVLNDRSAFSYAGVEPMSAVLSLTRIVPPDADPVVSISFARLLQGLDRLYDGLPDQAAYRAYASRVLEPIFERVGWDRKPGESDNVGTLRVILIETLGEFGEPKVLEEAQRRFEQFRRDPESLKGSARRSVLNVVAGHADPAIWEELHHLAQTARTELERREFYDLLADSDNETLVARALDLALSDEPPPTLGPGMIRAASDRHPRMAFDFTVAHWDRIATQLEPTSRARFVPRLLRSAASVQMIESLDAFAAHNIPADARQEVQKTEALIRYQAQIREQRLPQVDRWLEASATASAFGSAATSASSSASMDGGGALRR